MPVFRPLARFLRLVFPKNALPFVCGTAFLLACPGVTPGFCADTVSSDAGFCGGEWRAADREAYELLWRENGQNRPEGLSGVLCTDSSPQGLDALNLNGEGLSGSLLLRGLEDLYSVDVGSNTLIGATLAALPRLESVNASANELESVVLDDLPKLVDLSLEHNWLETLEGFGSLPSLTWLALEKNRLNDISGLRGAPALEALRLGDNELEDITVLADLPALKRLELQGNRIACLAPLAPLGHLRELNLASNMVEDILPLQGMVSLERLNLARNRVCDPLPLKDLVNLRQLDLGGNRLSDAQVLAGLTRLRSLELGGNSISDLSALKDLTSLAELSLDGNGISDITPLANLRDLLGLRLRENRITDVSALQGMASLIYLDLAHNWLTSLEGIRKDLELEVLDVSGNRLPLYQLYAAGRFSGQYRLCNLDDQQNVYFALRIQYLPVSSTMEIPPEDAFFDGASSQGRLFAADRADMAVPDGVRYAPAAAEGLPARLSFHTPGYYKLALSHPAISNVGVGAVIYEREEGDGLAYSTTGLILALDSLAVLDALPEGKDKADLLRRLQTEGFAEFQPEEDRGMLQSLVPLY